MKKLLSRMPIYLSHKLLSIACILITVSIEKAESFQLSRVGVNCERITISREPSSSTTELSAACHQAYVSRRKILGVMGMSGVASFLTGAPQPSAALDMDAFISKELEVDKSKTYLSDDVKTCKYAAPGKEKGDACVRAGISIAGKNGGVNAYGEIDRGDFVRCKTSYPMIDGKYVKTITCQ